MLYVHWWDVSGNVEEMMRGLHALVMAGKVLYLGVSDTPAWIVVKANDYARHHGLTPFSMYQGRWNAAYRDMESEIIPMCEDQGMAIISWASLGGGQLATDAQRQQANEDQNGGKGFYNASESDIAVSRALEKLAEKKGVTLQQVAVAYLFHQSTHVFPIVGVQTVSHIEAMAPALSISLSDEEIDAIQDAAPFTPLFPMSFIFGGGQRYSTRLTAADQTNYQMAAWIDTPRKRPGYAPRL